MVRINYFDNLKGLSILSVIIGHLYLYYNPDSFIFSFIQCFHMPIFIFISGFLSYKNKADEYNISFFVKKRTKSILIPYISFCLIYIFINGIGSTYSLFCGFTRGGLWFLPTIYILNILGYLIFKYYSNSKINFIIIILVEFLFIILRYVLPVDISNIFLIRHLTTYWLIYATGYLFNKYNIQITDKIGAIITIIFVTLWGAIELYIETNEIFRMILRFSSSLSIIYFFSKLNSNRINLVFGLLGRESLCIYVIHYSILMLCGSYMKEVFSDSDLLQFIFFIFLSFIISYICVIIKKILCKNLYFRMYLFGEFKK